MWIKFGKLACVAACAPDKILSKESNDATQIKESITKILEDPRGALLDDSDEIIQTKLPLHCPEVIVSIQNLK